PASTRIDTVSLHDALPISDRVRRRAWLSPAARQREAADGRTTSAVLGPSDPGASVLPCDRCPGRSQQPGAQADAALTAAMVNHRSEEHTSELQSRFDLVCR